MEEGSLLKEALEYMQRVREGSEEDGLNDVLQIDVFDLDPPSNRCEQLLRLAFFANRFNDEIGNCYYYIWYAGSPPVFAMHVSSGIPHLRAVCRYGNDVNDEWMTIRIMMDLSKKYPRIAVDVWDLGLGLPILLVEGSEGLPEWLAEGEVEDARHLCWVVGGSITVIGPTHVGYSLQEALNYLNERKMLTILEEVQAILTKTLDKIPANGHRAPLVLPRPVALLLQHMPQLANAAAVAYEKAVSLPATNHDDWVWTTCVMARTNYAILRTVQPKVPPRLSPELKRFEQTCANEATPHLRHALEVGMRITEGVDVLLLNQDAINEEAGISPIERRMLQYLPRLDIECGGDGDWLKQAWHIGPNRSSFDLTYLLKCPVFTEEQQYPYPISHPGSTMAQLICSEMKPKSTDERRSVMPRAKDVDDEEWMHRGDEALEEAIANRIPGATPEEQSRTIEARGALELDNVRKGFDKFMSGESDIKGVAHEQTIEEEMPLESAREPSAAHGPDEPIQINPRVFLNLLREVLVASPEDLERKLTSTSIDPYFSEQDYALIEPDDSLDEDATYSLDVSDMDALMHAMDSEIAQSCGNGEGRVHSAELSLTQDVHILSNLAQSLVASAGAPGPVSNILQELGVEPPMLDSDDIDENNE